MTDQEWQSLGFTIKDESYDHRHSGWEEMYEIKSPRLRKGFYVYNFLIKLDYQAVKEKELLAYIIQLMEDHKELIREQLSPYYLKIAQGTNLDELTAVIKIPTK